MPRINIKIRRPKNEISVLAVLDRIYDQVSPKMTFARLDAAKNRMLLKLKNYMESKRKRSKKNHDEPNAFSRLNNLFKVIEEFSAVQMMEDGSVRLVLIDEKVLDFYAPYWYKLNYGGKIDVPVSALGQKFVPGYWSGNAPRGKFYYTGALKGRHPGMVLSPTSVIEPTYYLNELVRYFRDEIQNFNRTVKEVVKKAKKSSPKTSLLSGLTNEQIYFIEKTYKLDLSQVQKIPVSVLKLAVLASKRL